MLSFYTSKNNWVSVSTIIENDENNYSLKYDFLTGVSGVNKDIEWDNISTKKNIAEIKIIDSLRIELKWFGFYDTKLNFYKFIKNPFAENEETVILERSAR